ncbi:unnamed protein product, partial [Allacma fusca]
MSVAGLLSSLAMENSKAELQL